MISRPLINSKWEIDEAYVEEEQSQYSMDISEDEIVLSSRDIDKETEDFTLIPVHFKLDANRHTLLKIFISHDIEKSKVQAFINEFSPWLFSYADRIEKVQP